MRRTLLVLTIGLALAGITAALGVVLIVEISASLGLERNPKPEVLRLTARAILYCSPCVKEGET